jgi:hypothetical protein
MNNERTQRSANGRFLLANGTTNEHEGRGQRKKPNERTNGQSSAATGVAVAQRSSK